MANLPYRSWVEVSRGRIAANFRAVRRLTGSAIEVVPVVKADAYRHGAVEVSRVLETAGASWLAVSNVEEGVILRQAGIHARILVMADFLPAERSALREFRLTPVVHDLDSLGAIDAIAYHLKIDSGMGRLGSRASAGEIAAAVATAPKATIEGLMTHFASSADYGNPQTEEQTQAFLRVVEGLRGFGITPRYIHMSSTNPVAYGRRAAWGNMVRPGHAIYGYVSPARGEAPERLLEVSPALSWKAAILAVKQVPEGALIGYGGMFRASRPMRIGVLAAGYADGLPHRLSNKGKVIAGGKLVPILGAVSMDLTTIDLTSVPHLGVGDAVAFIGQEGDAVQDAQQIARAAGTISYRVLCGISARVKRVYVD